MKLSSAFFFLTFLVTGLHSVFASGEKDSLTLDHDTAYIKSTVDLMTTRLYYSKKYTGIHINFDQIDPIVLKYRPNTTNNLGVGFTYKWATLNLAYGFGFMNPDKGKGETRYLDLQTHQYFRKFAVDLFGQFYKGYFLTNELINDVVGETYTRPDIRVIELGVSVEYVPNGERFSHRAAFIQNEIQKKTAATWLYGGEVFYGQTQSDSSIVPYVVPVEREFEFDKMDFFKVGPKGGGAITLVWLDSFFLTLSATIGANVGFYHLTSEAQKIRDPYFSLDLNLRASMGYNKERYAFNVLFVNNGVQYTENFKNRINTGNLRMIFSYRIQPPNFLKKSKYFK